MMHERMAAYSCVCPEKCAVACVASIKTIHWLIQKIVDARALTMRNDS